MNKNSLILHMIDELRMGGAQTHLRTILKAWLKLRDDRHVVVSLFRDGEIGDELRDMGIQVITLDLAREIQKRHYLKAEKSIRAKILELKPDLVEAHLSYSRILGQWAASNAGIEKRFSFEHGDVYLKSIGWRLANRWGQSKSQKTIVVSQAMADWMVRTHGISRDRIVVLHNCIDPEAFRTSDTPSITRGSLDIEREGFVFVAVGSLGAGVNKRMDICIRALAETRRHRHNAYLLICGDGPKRDELANLAKQCGVSAFVKFLGVRQDVPDVLKIADAFCHAATFEPFGLVCMEAMFSGLPVLVPDSGGIVEIVEHEVSGLKYPVLNWTELSRNMIRLIENPAKSKQMGTAGRDFVMKHLTVDKYLKALWAIYGI